MSVFGVIQSGCGKTRTRITPNTDTSHAVLTLNIDVKPRTLSQQENEQSEIGKKYHVYAHIKSYVPEAYLVPCKAFTMDLFSITSEMFETVLNMPLEKFFSMIVEMFSMIHLLLDK